MKALETILTLWGLKTLSNRLEKCSNRYGCLNLSKNFLDILVLFLCYFITFCVVLVIRLSSWIKEEFKHKTCEDWRPKAKGCNLELIASRKVKKGGE